MSTRRQFLRSSGAALLGASLVSRVQAASLPEAPIQASPLTQPPLAPPNGQPYNPVVTLNGWTLPWRMKDGVKEFHLIAEPVVREIAPGMKANLWGYNGQSPGTDDRGRRRRQGAPLRHQPFAGTHEHSLAWPAPAQWHGWRCRSDPAGDSAGQDLRL